MYRVRSVIKVTVEGWPAAIENAARINDLAEKRGWQKSTIWTQTFGPFNELAFEREYPDSPRMSARLPPSTRTRK